MYSELQKGFYMIAESLFAGCCLLAILTLPGLSSSITSKSLVPIPIDSNSQPIYFAAPDSSYGYPTAQKEDLILFNMLSQYSDKAYSVSICFQILASISFLMRLDMAHKNFKQFKVLETRNSSRMLISGLALICILD